MLFPADKRERIKRIKMLEMNSRAALAGPAMNQANQQHRRLLVALTLLLVALAVVLVWLGRRD
jgi:heme A synthase